MTSLLPNIWAVRVPKDAIEIELWSDRIFDETPYIDWWLKGTSPQVREEFLLPVSQWSLIGVGISEEVAGKIVDKGSRMFPDYELSGSLAKYGRYILYNATDSLISLLKSKGLNTEDNYCFLKLND